MCSWSRSAALDLMVVYAVVSRWHYRPETCTIWTKVFGHTNYYWVQVFLSESSTGPSPFVLVILKSPDYRIPQLQEEGLWDFLLQRSPQTTGSDGIRKWNHLWSTGPHVQIRRHVKSQIGVHDRWKTVTRLTGQLSTVHTESWPQPPQAFLGWTGTQIVSWSAHPRQRPTS